MTKELIHLWIALIFALIYSIVAYTWLQAEYKDLEKRLSRVESVVFDSARCYKDITNEQKT